MFRFACGALFVGLGFGFARGHHSFDLRALVVVLPSALLVGAALLHWATHPGGIKDTWSGGSITLAGTNPQRLEWSDWALWLTHTGRIDRRAALVRVEKRLLMGLIPLGSVVKSTRDYNQVHLDEQVRTARRRHRGLIFDSYSTEATHLTLTLVLTNAAGERLELLDLNTALDAQRGQRFMQELKAEVENAVSTPQR